MTLKLPIIILGLLLSGAMAPLAHAEEAAGQSTAESSGFLGKLQKYGFANYLLWAQGMRTEALSGNKDGTGTSLEFDHFLSAGAKLTPNISLKATYLAAQHIDELPESEKKQWQPQDPYFTLSHSKILSSDLYAANLEGYIRYYAPISRGTSDALNAGTARDGGLGTVRLLLGPSKTFLDGKLSLTGTVFGNYRFNQLSSSERLRRQTLESLKNSKITPTTVREDFYVVLNPSVAYAISSKVEVYIEWASGYLRHTTDGRWSSIGHPSDGAYLSPGVNWNPTKKIHLNPYLSYQMGAPADQHGLAKMDIGLQAQYSFL
jgi:hypothetical protein